MLQKLHIWAVKNVPELLRSMISRVKLKVENPKYKILTIVFGNFPIYPNKQTEDGRLLAASCVVPARNRVSLKLQGIHSLVKTHLQRHTCRSDFPSTNLKQNFFSSMVKKMSFQLTSALKLATI